MANNSKSDARLTYWGLLRHRNACLKAFMRAYALVERHNLGGTWEGTRVSLVSCVVGLPPTVADVRAAIQRRKHDTARDLPHHH